MKSPEEKIKIYIVRLMIVGLFISLCFTAFGAILYIIEYGGHKLNMLSFNHKAIYNIDNVFIDAIHLDPLAMVVLGIFLLVILQFLRTILVLVYFIKIKDRIFICLSTFTALVLLFSCHNA